MKELKLENSSLSTLVDDDVAEKLSGILLYLNYKGYIQFNLNNNTTMLSRFILEYYGKDNVDHIDNNNLNNQRSNLRVLSSSDNNARKERMIGVTGYPNVKRQRGRYFSNLKVNGKMLPTQVRATAFQAAVDAQNLSAIYRPNIEVNIVFATKGWVGI